MNIYKSIIIAVISINILGFILMGIDKYKSKKHRWRIKEKTLFTIAALGGSIGLLIGMYTFRHKTKHASFVWGIPTIIILQVLLVHHLIK